MPYCSVTDTQVWTLWADLATDLDTLLQTDQPESSDLDTFFSWVTLTWRLTLRWCVFPQGSAGYPSVLDSSEISTENGRTSRFPRPEMEISFSPLQPNRVALRRQGEEGSVTVKITRSARKRKSGEMDKVRTNQTKVGWSHIPLSYPNKELIGQS